MSYSVYAKHCFLFHPSVTATISGAVCGGRSTPKAFFQVKMATATAAADAGPASSTSLRRKKTGSPATLYEVLRVDATASQTEIKAAYRSLAKLYHPDCSSSSSTSPECDADDRNFIEIHDAYATLSDPASRARYDLSIGSLAARYFGYSTASSDLGLRFTRRWETDQCW
ncbi:hypothetical protein SAY86_025973 [Trapa natans]|uniref:J domain-containing protein n=1 Tax=Trapa natans TaxID=22666 RepID=A0AAN7QEI5_TRANT|nr:hypothetical protein SAY86_025973 [Trapa natans]